MHTISQNTHKTPRLLSLRRLAHILMGGALLALLAGCSNPSPSTVTYSTTTTLSAAPNPSTLGEPVGVTASVNYVVRHPGGVFTVRVPNGTATLYDLSTDPKTNLETANVSNGVAAFSVSTLTDGTHPLEATFNGGSSTGTSISPNISYNPSTSAPFYQVIGSGSGTTTTVTSSANFSLSGQTVTFTAAVAPVSANANTPTGTVTFSVDGTAQPAANVDSAGQATFTTGALALGPHTITAAYSGDSNFAGSSSGSLGSVVQAVKSSDPVLTVTTNEDDAGNVPPDAQGNVETLRDAVVAAAPGAEIEFDPTVFAAPQMITLTNGTLVIGSTVTIQGPTAGVALDGNGASQVLAVSAGTATLSGLTIQHGSGAACGGITVDSGAAAALTDCTIADNSAGAGAIASGILNAGTLTLTNCTLAGNSAAAVDNTGRAMLTDCTLTGNASGLDNPGAATLTDDILYGDTSGEISGSVTATYCDIQGGASGTGNINADPQFDPKGLQSNGGPTQTIALQSTSPCLEAGTPVSGVTTDQRGGARNNFPDIGAYELTPAGTPGQPTANPQSVTTNENTAVAVTLMGTDPDTPPLALTYAIATQPSQGTLSGTAPNLTYTPASGYYGADSFTFTVSNGANASSAAAVSIAVNQAATHLVVAVPASTEPGQSVPVTVTAQDAGGNTVTGYSGTATLTSTDAAAILPTSVTLTNGVGTASVTFQSIGSQTVTATSGSLTGTSSGITVAVGTPTANAQSVIGSNDAPVTVTLSGTDPDNPPLTLTYAVATQPSHGTLSGTAPNLTYTPHAGFSGVDSFTFTASNSTNTSSAATVSIAVAIGTPAASSQSVTTTENTAVPITLAGTDPDTTPLPLSYAVASQPAHGTLSGTAPNLTYTPASNYYGTDSFTFTASNGTNASSPATVGIAVNQVATHFAVSLPTSTTADQPVMVTVTAQDAGGATVTGYSGTATITSTDSKAVLVFGTNGPLPFLPASVNLINGVSKPNIGFRTAGTQTITATSGSLTGTSNGIAVAGLASTTALTSSLGANAAVFGQSVTVTASVTGGLGTPTGSVVFSIDGVAQSPVSLVSGKATLTTSSLSAGTHTITAAYSGGGSYAPSSTAAPLSLAVSQAATSTAVTSNVNPASDAQSITLTAAVSPTSPGAGTPTGTVVFTLDGTAQPSVSMTGGSANLVLPHWNPGQHLVTAAYSGDADFTASTSSTFTQNVNQPVSALTATTTTVASSLQPSISGQSVTFTATVTGASSTPGDTVTFSIDNVAQTPVTLANGTAALTTSSLSIGTHSVTATYSGSSVFASSSTGKPLTQTVNAASTVPSAPTALHTFPTGMQMISVPENYADVSLADAWNAPAAQTLYTWNGGPNYLTGTALPAPGQGAWVILGQSANVYDTGVSATTTFSITLAQGWNLIGNPFASDVTESSLEVTKGSSTVPFAQANTAAVVSSTLYTYQAGDTTYEVQGLSGKLKAYQGYWLYAFQPCSLLVPPPATPAARR